MCTTRLLLPSQDFDRPHDIPAWRQFDAFRRDVTDIAVHFVENEHRRPTVVMQRFLVTRFQRHVEHPELVVFEENLVVFRGSGHGVEFRVPSRGV